MSEVLDPKQYAEEELKLKKRARRRLVGATVLVFAAVVFLPWALKNEPKVNNDPVEIEMPSRDKPRDKDFQTKVTPVRPDASSISADKPLSAEKPVKVEPPLADKPVVKAERDTKSEKPLEKVEKPAEPKVDKPKDTAKVEKEPVKAEKPKDTAKVEKEPVKAEKPKDAVKVDKEPKVDKAEKPKEPAKSEKVDKAEKAEKVEKAEKTEHAFIIQVGAFRDPAKAKSTQAQIAAAGYKSYTESIETEGGPVTRVRAGPFPNKEKAEAARAQLQLEGLSGKVVPR